MHNRFVFVFALIVLAIAVFKTVDRRLSAAMVGSTPTRFRHISIG